jgi:hypothetical protein
MWTALNFLTIGSGRFLANTILGFTNDKSLETFLPGALEFGFYLIALDTRRIKFVHG